jgi:arylsulfatase A-like enzyme
VRIFHHALLSLGLLATHSFAAAPATKPNVIIIFTDDHGYTDLGCQGMVKDLKTPHMDALAAAGVRMTSGYVTAPQCSPSRCGLISGQFQGKFGMDNNKSWSDVPGLSENFFNQKTLPDRMKDAGYLTGKNPDSPHEALYWKWEDQFAIRKGDMKYLFAGNRHYLFNLADDLEEKHNLYAQKPGQAKELREQLSQWSRSLIPAGLDHPVRSVSIRYFDFYLDGRHELAEAKEGPKPAQKKRTRKTSAGAAEQEE